MTRVLVRCVDCDRVLTGEKTDIGIRPIGTAACPDCEGTDLQEVTADAVDSTAM